MRPLALLALFSLATSLALASDLQGRVVAVQDGDTLTVLDDSLAQHKVRLAGIDAPEKGQAFGQRSKQALSDCAYGRYVHIEGRKLDRYGRLIGKVESDGIDCNLRQVSLGFAWHYKAYEREQSVADREAYALEETGAQQGRRGLWASHAPTPPWEFRRSARSASKVNP